MDISPEKHEVAVTSEKTCYDLCAPIEPNSSANISWHLPHPTQVPIVPNRRDKKP